MQDEQRDGGLRLVLALDAGADPIAGSVGTGDGDERPFTGYVELIAVLEALMKDPKSIDR